MGKLKIAIVYDWMDKMGGVERMLLVLHEMYPQAVWYTSFYDEKVSIVQKLRVRSYEFGQKKVKTSFMQGLPLFIKKSRILSLPFFLFAFESFDFSAYDLVISVTSSFAKGIITTPKTKHVCILLTPTRWLWGQDKSYELGVKSYWIIRPIIHFFIHYLKRWDLIASSRPDTFISISQTVADRCLKYYHRSSEVVYPPFDGEYWKLIRGKGSLDCGTHTSLRSSARDDKREYFLVVSRLEPYKKVETVIEAFNMMPDKNVIIIGAGSQADKLARLASRNCQFISHISDDGLARYYSHAEALIMPQEEDFGYVALEAQACGCPVISYSRGGACETVTQGVTGTFFDTQSAPAVRDAVAHFRRDTYNLDHREVTISKFSVKSFRQGIEKHILQVTERDAI